MRTRLVYARFRATRATRSPRTNFPPYFSVFALILFAVSRLTFKFSSFFFEAGLVNTVCTVYGYADSMEGGRGVAWRTKIS